MFIFTLYSKESLDKLKFRLRKCFDDAGVRVGKGDEKIDRILVQILDVRDISSLYKLVERDGSKFEFTLNSRSSVYGLKDTLREVLEREGLRVGKSAYLMDNILSKIFGVNDINVIYGLAKREAL